MAGYKCQLSVKIWPFVSYTLIQTLLIQNLGQDCSGLKAELHLLSTSLLGYTPTMILYTKRMLNVSSLKSDS